MKRHSFQTPGAIAAMALLVALAVINPSGVLSGGARASGVGLTLMPELLADAATHKAHKASTPVEADKDSVEAHIKNLHDKFQITAAQEGQWKKVADVMRDNADRITSLARARSERASRMTAVDDLKSYAEITEAHETGVAKLLPVFTTLYNDMSDTQRKAADAEFRERHHRHQM